MFKKGDIVKLKCGGPLMVVVRTGFWYGCVCNYFNGSALVSINVPQEALYKA